MAKKRDDKFEWKDGDVQVVKRVYKGKVISEEEWQKMQKQKKESPKK